MDKEEKVLKQRGTGRHKHTCPNCHERFLGRKNAKFCSEQCKNDCNNDIYRDHHLKVIEIDKIFHKNRKIADEIAQQDNPTATHTQLLKKGYELKYFTHKVNCEEGLIARECEAIYDYALVEINKNPLTYKIVYTDEF